MFSNSKRTNSFTNISQLSITTNQFTKRNILKIQKYLNMNLFNFKDF